MNPVIELVSAAVLVNVAMAPDEFGTELLPQLLALLHEAPLAPTQKLVVWAFADPQSAGTTSRIRNSFRPKILFTKDFISFLLDRKLDNLFTL